MAALGPSSLFHPLAWRIPLIVFVNSLSDSFHAEWPDDDLDTVFGVMAAADRHCYQVLTKRADRLSSWTRTAGRPDRVAAAARRALAAVGREMEAESINVGWPLPNAWLGVSAETQR